MFCKLKGFLLDIYWGPNFNTKYKYAAKIVRTGTGLDMNIHESTSGSEKLKNKRRD